MAAADFIDASRRLAEQEGWSDISPLQDLESSTIVAIKYTQEDREVLQYFLAIAASGEKSLRALALTEAVSGLLARSMRR